MSKFVKKKIFEMVQYDSYNGEYKMTVKKLLPSFILAMRDDLVSTGEWLFFNKTDSTQKSEEVESSLLLKDKLNQCV